MGELGPEPKSSDCQPGVLFFFFFLGQIISCTCRRDKVPNGCPTPTLYCDLCFLFLQGLRGRELTTTEHQLYTIGTSFALKSHYTPTIIKAATS